jgi:hypothetical protein
MWSGSASRIFAIFAVSIMILTCAAHLSFAVKLQPAPIEDRFDPRLAQIDTVAEVVAASDRIAAGRDTYARVRALEELLRYRFHHGYSHYSFSENWLLWLAGKVVHPHLTAKVDPHDILQEPWAACSQQAIVVQTALERMGVVYATVEWPGHFTAAAFISGDWYVVDPWGPMDRDRSRLWKLEDWVDRETRAEILGPKAAAYDRMVRLHPPRLVKINQFPAQTMSWLHPLTRFLSDWLWLAAALALLWLNRRSLELFAGRFSVPYRTAVPAE